MSVSHSQKLSAVVFMQQQEDGNAYETHDHTSDISCK